MTDNRDKRLAMWREGHACSNWWECPLCLKRQAEIDAKYPKEASEAKEQ